MIPARLGRRFGVMAFALAVLLLVPALGHAADLSGEWSGTWQSCITGHKGVLKGTFCRIDEGHYRVDFRGRFFKIMPFRYSVTLNVVEEGETVKLSGDSYLGRLIGTFTYEASATSTDFTANYSSCKDSGTFVMSRCCEACCEQGCE